VKLGAENRSKVIAAAALGVVAVVLLAFELPAWFGGSSSSASTAMPSPASSATNPSPVTNSPSAPRINPTTRNAGSKKTVAQNLDPSLRFDLLKLSEETKYEGAGRNIFRVFVEPPPKPVVPVAPAATPEPQAYVPPPPPPIELKFYGFATPAGGTKRVFLAHAEDVFIAKEGDIVNRRYKVLKISPNSVDILDVLSNNRQTIPLTQG
jgi:hypothetical protein